MNMVSDSANLAGCADIGVAGDLTEPLKGASSIDAWTSPQWPVEGDVILNARLPNSAVYPVGKDGTVLVVTLNFDGAGNVIFPSTQDAEPEWSGVIVKR